MPFLTFKIISLSLVALANFVLGIFIISKSSSKTHSFFLFLVAFINALYALSYALIYLLPETRLIWARTTWIGVGNMPAFIYFLHHYLQIKISGWKSLLLLVVSGTVIILGIFTDLLVKDVIYLENNFYVQQIPGSLDTIARIVIYFLVFLIFYNIIKSYQNVKAEKKLRLKYLLWGVGFYCFTALFFGVIIPILSKVTAQTDELLPACSLIWAAFASYAIIRYRLLEFETFIHKTIGWLLLIGLTLLPCTTVIIIIMNLAKQFQWPFIIVIILLIIALQLTYFFYQYFKDKIDHIFQRRHYEVLNVMEEFVNTLHALFKLEEVIRLVKNKIKEIFYIKVIEIYLFDKNNNRYYQYPNKNSSRIFTYRDQFIEYLRRQNQIVEKDQEPEWQEIFISHQAELVIPLPRRGQLPGFIILGKKSNGKIFSPSDIDLLNYLGKELTITIENSLYYEQILKVIEKERQLEKIKSEFISIFAHQMRTPLAEVKWSQNMLIDGDYGEFNEEQKNVLKRSSQANKQVIDLVDSLLSIAQLEKGEIKYNFRIGKINNLLSEILKETNYLAENKKIKIEYLNKNLIKSPLIIMDYVKLKIAVNNIVDNAIKYSKVGGKIKIQLEEYTALIKIIIEDNGIGFNPEEKQNLFVKFFRGERAMKTETRGSGLGMYLAKNIIQAHQGEIEVDSSLSQGTKVSIILPKNEKK